MSNPQYDLVELARKAMLNRGLTPNFSRNALQELNSIVQPAPISNGFKDLRTLTWCSIDNDDSLDLDQLTYAEKGTDGNTTIWVAVADVDALVLKDSSLDMHAQANTTSVYTPAIIFPMLPEKLSTNLTSLNENADRVAMIIKIQISPTGDILENSIFEAAVRNHAKLTYNNVGNWLAGQIAVPEKIGKIPDLEKTLRCQHEITQILKRKRHALGALTLESPEAETKEVNHEIKFERPLSNFANQLIENFMIAANAVMSQHFKQAHIPGLQRVVRVPKRWDRIVDIAANLGEKLPVNPDAKALEDFLVKRKAIDPVTFPDLSLTVIKLLGRGEYVVQVPGSRSVGHFGLALREYTHSTAPNRRFPDLIMQRQYKSYLRNEPAPYSLKELEKLAAHCTEQEDAATKVERQMNKSASAMYLEPYIGKTFEGIITGASDKGTWVRCFDPPVEGRVIRGYNNLDVGDRVEVRLVSVDVPRGYIDFAASPSPV